MDIISANDTDRLYWLGRYSERVYTTTRLFSDTYDTMIDNIMDDYKGFCKRIDIPDCYESSEDFIKSYCFSGANPDSIYSNLMRAFDNAVTLRDVLSSEILSYIQLAVYSMNQASASDAPLVELQGVCDNILAFWGIADDSIESEHVRNIIKVGKRIERLDLYGRLSMPRKAILREVHRLQGRIPRTPLKYDAQKLAELSTIAESPVIEYYGLVSRVNSLLLN